MREKIYVPVLGILARIGDILMIPIMYLVSGTFAEAPQQTHRWNNKKISKGETDLLDKNLMVKYEGQKYSRLQNGVLLHIPILGGPRKYVVIGHEISHEWYVGWVSENSRGISQIKLSGPIRLLTRRYGVSFFGLKAKDFSQIKLIHIDKGNIGDRSQFSQLRLL